MKKLFVPLVGQYDPEDPQMLERPALAAAFSLARRLEAHVSAVALVDPPSGERKSWPVWLPGGGMAQLCDMIDAASEKRREHATKIFDEVLAEQDPKPLQTADPAPGYSTHFSEAVGRIETLVGPLGRLADMSVLSSPDTNWADPFTPLIRVCLTDTGRPVLVTPMQARGDIGRSIAIAWDGSEGAARAISASLPLLKLADTIAVFSAEDPDKPGRDPNEVVDYLGWHGIDATAETVLAEDHRPEQAVLETVIARGHDLIIIGARLHTRAHRLIFGSMTELVLDRPRIAALLA